MHFCGILPIMAVRYHAAERNDFMLKSLPRELQDYAVALYRRLHQIPEIGFDLYKTVAEVKKELDAMDIPYSEAYGQCSLVGYLGHKENVPTLGLRADMDALPIGEQVDVPFASKTPGVMHACGHDSHTAILLTVAKYLKSVEGDLPCNIRLFFQPSEEGAVSGAHMMVENGCLEGVDRVLCVHCEGSIPSGSLGIQFGDAMAACVPLTLKFHGLSSHATLPEKGIDAIAMAVDSYGELKAMVKEEAGDRPYIWSVGVFQAGEVHNVIADLCTQKISFRFYDLEFAERVHKRTEEIIERIAKRYGGRAELEWHMSCGPVYNDPDMANKMCAVADQLGIPMVRMEPKRSSEDFAWFTSRVPGVLFRYGIHCPEDGCTATAHRPDFKIHEPAMEKAILAFIQFVLSFA